MSISKPKEKHAINVAKTTIKKKILITCKEPGCGSTFKGYPNTKYCKDHKEPINRQSYIDKINANKTNIEDGLFIFNEIIEEKTIIERPCGLEGCCNTYKLILYPGQSVYPKYCEEHRNLYKRELFIQRLENAKKR